MRQLGHTQIARAHTGEHHVAASSRATTLLAGNAIHHYLVRQLVCPCCGVPRFFGKGNAVSRRQLVGAHVLGELRVRHTQLPPLARRNPAEAASTFCRVRILPSCKRGIMILELSQADNFARWAEESQ
jgi:hypothetical protein